MNSLPQLSAFWHWFIIVITVASILGCLWLLFANAKAPGGSDTGHVWDDDLREYNNPLPRWWLIMFILTIVFALGYLAYYPGLGNFSGQSNWSSGAEMQQKLDQVQASRRQRYAAFSGLPIETIAANPDAMSLGRELFMNNCAGCHGADARGAIGFPNLVDKDWLYGGDPETILASIRNGRGGQMPNFNAMLKPESLDDLILTLRGWSDPGLDPDVRERGMKQFSYTCAGCHGAEGHGNPAVGAPNLTDGTWLYGGSYDQVRKSILFGRHGNMPAQRDLLTEEEIRLLAGFVYGQSRTP